MCPQRPKMVPLLTGGQKTTTKLSKSTNSTIHSRHSDRQLRYQERPKTQFTADIQTDSRAFMKHAPKYNSPRTFTQTADLSNTPKSTIHCRHSHRQPTYQTRPRVQFTADIHTGRQPSYQTRHKVQFTADTQTDSRVLKDDRTMPARQGLPAVDRRNKE